jgi:predicted PurR-regulated permease PerM
MAEPAPAPVPGSPAPTPRGARREPPARRTRVLILLSFLGAFLTLLIVFRAVLFPFLMAIFIAYLIEPVVERVTRARILGIRWTRGPTIVLMYVVVLGAIVMATSCAVTGLARTARRASEDIRHVLAERGEGASLTVEGGELPAELRLPAGTRVVLPPQVPPVEPASAPAAPDAPPAPPPPPAPEAAPALPPAPPVVMRTLHDVRLPPGDAPPRVLLATTLEPVPAGARVGDVLDEASLRMSNGKPLPPGRRLRLKAGEPAKGLELWTERSLISPLTRNLEKAGIEVDPAPLRELLHVKQEAFGADISQLVAQKGAVFALGVAKSLYLFLLILMLTAFIVMDRKHISGFFASLPPDHLKPEYGKLMEYVDRGLAGVIRGQLVICMVNGVLTYVGLLLLGVQGAGMLSLAAGILSLIPIFGTIVSSIPIVLVAATQNLTTGVLSLAWIGLIHLVEANFLNPLIMGSHANMHPVVIIFALLAGEHAFGVWGALLAVPTMSILQSCFLFYRHEIEGLPRSEQEPHGAGLRRMLGRLLGRGRT